MEILFFGVPLVNAAQWDDDGRYQGGVSGEGDRTLELTNFVQKAIAATKAANPLSGEPEKMADEVKRLTGKMNYSGSRTYAVQTLKGV
ncbi:hypothetical protein [Oscillatoria sp. HE19RPO]|uniref:hypothetical protein n=1 Tax=Oscillatoria sp. HE19RPO TaxID=2954806 RepID=UPI0020C2B361|nr:hypothetical protein [Oscillatoria sp. HE19RPO]